MELNKVNIAMRKLKVSSNWKKYLKRNMTTTFIDIWEKADRANDSFKEMRFDAKLPSKVAIAIRTPVLRSYSEFIEDFITLSDVHSEEKIANIALEIISIGLCFVKIIELQRMLASAEQTFSEAGISSVLFNKILVYTDILDRGVSTEINRDVTKADNRYVETILKRILAGEDSDYV